MPKRFSVELKERALRMLAEARSGYSSELEAIRHVAGLLGVGVETLRKWQRQAEVDAGDKPGVSTGESVEVRRLKREVAATAR